MKNLTAVVLLLGIVTGCLAQQIDITRSPQGILFTENKDTVLFYRTAAKSIEGKYARSNYLHPVYTLGGQVLTEDFPEDHPHQRGIFWAWHQLYIDSLKIGDGWDCRDINWRVSNIKILNNEDKAQTIQTYVAWQSPLLTDAGGTPRTIIKERTTLKVFPKTERYRIIDIEISLLATAENTYLGGSEDEKGYGGFSGRIVLPEDIIFNGTDGPVSPENTPVQSRGWIAMEGTLNQEIVGFAIMAHPDNPGYPNPWILRNKNSMQNAVFPYPGKKAILISKTQPTVLRYRLLIYQSLSISAINTLYKNPDTTF